uniref:Uncharacterized protein n=1 Tax=Oryza punctata TaxID=4537 RepID=A0A0E0MDC9_ORYPU
MEAAHGWGVVRSAHGGAAEEQAEGEAKAGEGDRGGGQDVLVTEVEVMDGCGEGPPQAQADGASSNRASGSTASTTSAATSNARSEREENKLEKAIREAAKRAVNSVAWKNRSTGAGSLPARDNSLSRAGGLSGPHARVINFLPNIIAQYHQGWTQTPGKLGHGLGLKFPWGGPGLGSFLDPPLNIIEGQKASEKKIWGPPVSPIILERGRPAGEGGEDAGARWGEEVGELRRERGRGGRPRWPERRREVASHAGGRGGRGNQRA